MDLKAIRVAAEAGQAIEPRVVLELVEFVEKTLKLIKKFEKSQDHFNQITKKTNILLDGIPFVEGNLPSGISTKLPDVTWRRLNTK